MTTMAARRSDSANAEVEAANDGVPPKKKRKKLIIGVVLLLVLGAGAFYELGGSSKGAAGGVAKTVAAAKPGPLVALDSVTVNLAGGHYLRVGVTLEFTSKVSASAPPDGAAALDRTIGYFTGQDAAPLQTGAGLENAKKGLKQEIAASYPDDPLYDVLFTSFVVQ